MKKNMIKATFLIILCSNLGSFKLQGQVKLEVSLENYDGGFLEPIYYEAKVINKTNKVQDLYRPSDAFDTIIFEYLLEDSTEWKEIGATKGYLTGLRSRPTFNLAARDTFIYNGQFFGYDIQLNEVYPDYLFKTAGAYKIRAKYYTRDVRSRKSKIVYSNEQELKINTYEGGDSKVVEFLLKKKNPHQLFDLIYSGTELEFPELLRFTKKFSEAPLVNWVRLLLIKRRLFYLGQEFDSLSLRNKFERGYRAERAEFVSNGKEIYLKKLEELIENPTTKQNVKFEAKRILQHHRK